MIAAAADGEREIERLLELKRLRILDSEPEERFDAIVRAAAALFDAPISAISVIDRDRQWFKAIDGLNICQADRESSFCGHAIHMPSEVMVVPDALQDIRFHDNPLVTGELHIRFYAGAPLVSRNGFAIGTLCVIDRVAHAASTAQVASLHALARLTMQLIEERAEHQAGPRGALLEAKRASAIRAGFGWNPDGSIRTWNDSAQLMFGWSAAQMMGEFPPFILPEDAPTYRADCIEALTGTGRVERLATLRTKDENRIAVSLVLSRGVDANANVFGVALIEDIGARHAAQRRLAMLESVVVNSTDAVIVMESADVDVGIKRVVYVNDAFTRMTGYAAHEIVGGTQLMLLGPATDLDEITRVRAALRRRERVNTELVLYRKDGSPYRVECNLSPVVEADGSCPYFISIERETTARRALERYEHERRAILEMAIANEPLERQLNRIATLLRDVIPGSRSTIMFVRDGTLALAASDPCIDARYLEAIEGSMRIVPFGGPCGSVESARESVVFSDLETDERWQAYREIALAAGLRSCWSYPMFGTDGAVIGTFAVYLDRVLAPEPAQQKWVEETVRVASLVVERHRDRERLEALVMQDALTKLPNRKSFETRCEMALERARNSGGVAAVGVVDIDRFKAINDAYGHHVGDELLCGFSARLAESMRAGDCAARMSGDEFLITFADLADRADGAQAARRLVERFATPLLVEGHEILVRPSLGLAFYPETAGTLEDLLAAADAAMYAAKALGGGVELAGEHFGGRFRHGLDVENDLAGALERGEFELHYQLVFDLDDGAPVGAEALLRWNHPRLGQLAPGDFIALAKANGLIVPLSRWVLGEAARVARTWQDAGRDAFVSINLCSSSLDDPQLAPEVAAALAAAALEPRRLHLELRESSLMHRLSLAPECFGRLRELGVRIVLDDFGAGYSSVATLRDVPFDALKVDRAFIGRIGNESRDGQSARIVLDANERGKALHVETIAQGVETAAQYEFVQACGYDRIQGFWCARPVPAAQLAWNRIDPSRVRAGYSTV